MNIEIIKAAVEVLNRHGFNIADPSEGDLDDLERERFEAVSSAIEAALKKTSDALLEICDGSNWPEYAQDGVGYRAYTEITDQLHDICTR